jgi:hypothetical protein
VAVPGPPRVSTKIGPNTFSAATTVVSTTTKISGLIDGIEMYQKRWNQLAPSSSAASYSSGTTRWRPAMNITTG